MTLRHKMMLLGTIPLIIVIALISLMFIVQSSTLATNEIKQLRAAILAEKKAALINHIALAQSTIKQSYIQALNGNYTSQLNIATILRNMDYGEDGYFYVYDLAGKNIVHPKQPYRMGKNWIDLQDTNGKYIIRNIIETATKGSGFTTYIWEKPSSKQLTQKISYNVELEGLGWIFGTGLYVNDVTAQTDAIRNNVKSSITNGLLLTTFLTIISIVVIYIFTFTLNTRELSLADKRLLELNERIITAQEEERSRVSKELHDGVSQLITAIRFDIEHSKKALCLKYPEVFDASSLNGAIEKLKGVGQEIRRISHDLRPQDLDDLGLFSAIEDSIKELNWRSETKYEFQHSNMEKELPIGVTNTLFRIFQEASNNIEKHANAKLVLIELYCNEHHINMKISDDGTGFNMSEVEEKSQGIGLYNMRQRITAHKGSIDFASSIYGTIIAIKIPL